MTIVLDGNIVEVGGWWSGGGGIRELNDSLNVRLEKKMSPQEKKVGVPHGKD